MKTILNVEGMSCAHCAGAIKAELSEIDGVKDVIVEVETKSVSVEHEEKVAKDILIKGIEELGYEVVE